MNRLFKLGIALIILMMITVGFIAACGTPDDTPPEEAPGQEAPTDETIDDDPAGDVQDTELVAVGEDIVQSQTCLSCHGTDLEGTGAAPGLHGVGDRLSAEEIHDIIENGQGTMPGGLAAGNEEAVVAYLLTLE